MSDGITLRRGRRWPGALLVVPLGSALILVIGWSALWAVARYETVAGLDRLLASEAAHGRVWSCPDRAVTGFPFRIALSCHDVTFAGKVDGSAARGRLAGLSAEAWLYEPSSVYVALAGPLALTTADGRADFSLDWAGMRATLRGLVGGMKRIELLGEDVIVTRPAGQGGTARRIEVHAGPVIATAAGDDADKVEIALDGVAVPALDGLTGETAPLDGLFSGVVTKAFGDLPDFGTATVERWRASGGRLDVSNLTLTKGPLALGATGTMGLDDRHRLQGRLQASLAGFESLAKSFGLSLRTVEMGGMLANLLGKAAAPKPAAEAPPVAPGAVSLPIVFQDGAMAIGPFKTGLRLTPLY